MAKFPFAGLHFQTCTEDELLDRAFQVADILKKELRNNPSKQVIVRSVLPGHGVFDAYGDAIPGSKSEKIQEPHHCKQTMNLNHFTNYYMEQISDMFGFQYLNSAPIYKDRGDMHFPEREITDCTHWCYSPETYMPEIALLNQLLT